MNTPMNSAIEMRDMAKAKNGGAEIRQQPEACPICGGEKVGNRLAAPDRFHLRAEIYRLLRCSSCRVVWLTSPPKPEEMGLHYSEDYHKGIVAAGEGSVTSRWKNHLLFVQAAGLVDPALPIEWRIYGHDPSQGGQPGHDEWPVGSVVSARDESRHIDAIGHDVE